MGRYGPDEQKGYKASYVKGEPTAPLTELEKELYDYIEALEATIEQLEGRALTNEKKPPE